jgi:DNA-binding response OmpR family regulator
VPEPLAFSADQNGVMAMQLKNPPENPITPIDLAREPAFTLGAIEVRPSLREICLNKHIEVVEPRVMQVLVALAQADGTVVSRDQLIARCWDGRVVGDDAINRCIAKLRRLEVADPEGSFRIETVRRVGHRLLCVESRAEPRRMRRWYLIAMGAGAILLSAAIAFWLLAAG